MITGTPKPIREILSEITGAKKILVAGCGGCVTVHFVGGEREAGVLASLLRIAGQREGSPFEIITKTVERQCDWEFLEDLEDDLGDVDCVISLACGVGVQGLGEMYPSIRVIPGINTNMMGLTESAGVWSERCSACGECIIAQTGGICPVTRCAKRLLNGPCGGSQGGRCEISKDTPCAWQLIYDRLREQGRLDELSSVKDSKDWSKSLSGGPRTIKREDLQL